MTESRSLYEILGVPRDAKPHAIKAAYRAQAMRYHPDRLPPDATDEQKKDQLELFQELQDAYDILMDRERREQYDLSGQIPKSKAQLAQDAFALIIEAYTQTLSQMADMLAANPYVEAQMRSPVVVIDLSFNERIVACQQAARTARDKRKALKKLVRGLKRKDGSDASTSPVVLSLNALLKPIVMTIVNAETEIEMLRIAVKLNAEWDYTRPASNPEDDYDSMVAVMRIAYGDTPQAAPADAEEPDAEESEDGEDSSAEDDDDWPGEWESSVNGDPQSFWGR